MKAPINYQVPVSSCRSAKTALVHKLAGIFVAIMTIIGAPKASRAELSQLVQQVNLTPYARPTIPPHFNGRTIDGREISVSFLHGKVALLNFWATWCVQCRSEMPAFER